MNIIFEGINGSGKSTIIKTILDYTQNKKINVIDDINTETICSPILQHLFAEHPMMHIKKNFDTAVGESLILLTDFNCLMINNDPSKINIYDRFYFTTLIYQTYILKKYSKISPDFLLLYEKLLKINAVDIDYFIYVDIDIDTSILRTEKRDNRLFDNETKEFFTLMQKELKDYCINFCKDNNINLLFINGKDSIKDNIKKIKIFIPELKINI